MGASSCGIVSGSGRHRYFTDPGLLDLADRTLGRWGDPCADELSAAWSRAAWHLSIRRGECGLLCPWEPTAAWVNPPYDDAASWLEKCARHAAAGHEVLAIVPCQPGSAYWRRLVWRFASCVVFIGRPKFAHPLEEDDTERGLKAGDLVTTQHPTDVAVIGFGIDTAKMISIWSSAGVVVAPVRLEEQAQMDMSAGT